MTPIEFVPKQKLIIGYIVVMETLTQMNRNLTDKKPQFRYLLTLALIVVLFFLCKSLGPEHYNVWLAQ